VTKLTHLKMNLEAVRRKKILYVWSGLHVFAEWFDRYWIYTWRVIEW